MPRQPSLRLAEVVRRRNTLSPLASPPWLRIAIRRGRECIELEDIGIAMPNTSCAGVQPLSRSVPRPAKCLLRARRIVGPGGECSGLQQLVEPVWVHQTGFEH